MFVSIYIFLNSACYHLSFGIIGKQWMVKQQNIIKYIYQNEYVFQHFDYSGIYLFVVMT